MMKKPNIFIVASGTGGHVFPALAVADILHKSSDILWIGTDAGIEHKHVKYPILTIQIAGFRHKNLLRQVTVIKNLFGAIFSLVRYQLSDTNPAGKDGKKIVFLTSASMNGALSCKIKNDFGREIIKFLNSWLWPITYCIPDL